MSAAPLVLLMIFAEMSLLAFGGGNSVIPELQREVVELRHWMTAAQFSALYALAQAAPGPNMMIAPLIGWRVAGWPGLAAAALGMFGPSSLVTASVMTLWNRVRDRPWRAHVQAGVAPVTIGLIAASAALIVRSAAHSWGLALIAAASAVALIATRAHPLLVLALGALAGLAGLGG